MKFQVEHDVFTSAVSWVARTIPARPSLPVLGGIKLTARPDGMLSLISYDPEISSHIEIDAVVDEPGEVLVNGRLLSDFAKALPSRPISLVLEGSKLSLTCGSSKISMQTMPLEDFPNSPEFPEVTATVNTAALQQAVGQVVSSASNDDTLPLLVSVCIEITGDQLTLLATDRYRLALKNLQWSPKDPTYNNRILVRASRLADIVKNLSGESTIDVAIAYTERGGLLGFSCGGKQNIARMIDGDYPDVRGLFPQETTNHATIARTDLLDAIKRARLATGQNEAVVLSFSEGQVVLSAGKGDNAQTSEVLEADFVGEDSVLRFNPVFLLDGLSSMTTDYANFSFTLETSPAVVAPQEKPESLPDENMKLLLMPIRRG